MSKKVSTARQFFTYAGVGVIGTVTHYLTLIFLVEFVHQNPVIASSLGAVSGALVNYYLNYRFTFKSDKSHKDAIIKFMLVTLVGFMINLVIIYLFNSILMVNYLVAQVIATTVVLITNYSANRAWTFKNS